jgi:prepilin-type N-terminal cleavage/methylation domain-containing protein
MRLLRPLRRGFTLIELLTVIAIITLLMGLLVPSLTAVRRFARDTRQRAEFASIEAALMMFRYDYGDYPPSFVPFKRWNGDAYSGAQQLTEALVGRDLMGFHPQSGWYPDDGVYDPDIDPNTFDERRGRYLDMTHINAFRLGQLYLPGVFPSGVVYMPETFVLCDLYALNVRMADGSSIKAGAPILYYRANRSGREIYEIYNYQDNMTIMGLGRMKDSWRHAFLDPIDPVNFDDYIDDPRVDRLYPHRPDSFLLISAGADGLYGTADDIRNF